MTQTHQKVLLLAFEGIEELEAFAPVDLLRRAEIEVLIASVSDKLELLGRNGIKFVADTRLDQVDPDEFDLVILPGGPGVFELSGDSNVTQLLKSRGETGRLIAAICAAPKILAETGILQNRKATSHLSVRNDLPNPVDAPVVEDGPVITSQGAGTAIEFALSLITRLKGEETARAIASSIHFTY